MSLCLGSGEGKSKQTGKSCVVFIQFFFDPHNKPRNLILCVHDLQVIYKLYKLPFAGLFCLCANPGILTNTSSDFGHN